MRPRGLLLVFTLVRKLSRFVEPFELELANRVARLINDILLAKVNQLNRGEANKAGVKVGVEG